MAGSLAYTVVLDACVLYPAPLRDLLLSLASEGLFRARWTSEIHDEWVRNLLKNRPDIKEEALRNLVQLMNGSIDDCLVENYEYLIPTLQLPDQDDRHVLAAAIAGHADAIVTFNLKDFPNDAIEPRGIEILHPDDFLVAQYGLEPLKMLTAVKSIRARLKKSPRTPEQLIETYEAQGLPQTAALLKGAIHLI